MQFNFRKSLGVATVASVISFAISLGLTPVMTRWYQPDDYGTFALVNNVATFLATACLLSLPNALPMQQSWHRRAQLLRALVYLIVISGFVSIIIVGLLFLFSYFLGGADTIRWYWVSMPFLLITIALHRIAQGWANADGAFNSMAVARFIHPLISKPFAIMAGMFSTSSPYYMILFEGVAYFFQVVIMIRSRFKRLKNYSHLFTKRRIATTIGVIKRHQDYSLYLNFVNLLALGSIMFQNAILAESYSVTETGLFTLAMSMTSLPVQLISMATASVIYHRLIACARDNPKALSGNIFKIILSFVALGVVPYLVIFIYGSELFAFAFGSNWVKSGAVASVLAFPVFLQFIYTPISSVFRVTSRIKLQFMVDFSFVLPIIFIFHQFTHYLSFMDVLVILAAGMSLHALVGIGLCLHVARNFSKSKTS